MIHKLLLLVSILAISLPCVNSAETQPDIRFGLIADIQYADADKNGQRFYRNSLAKLQDCINDFNGNKLNFVVNLGDLIDRTPEDLPAITKILSESSAKVYNTTGNHDYKGFNNRELFSLLKMPSEYYSFEEKGWKFIMLNTNEIAPYSNMEGEAAKQELEEMLTAIKARKANNGASYNGGISKKQMQWLTTQLDEARDNSQKVIVFAHHPLYPENHHNALNDREILEILSKYPCVKAVISGHHHRGSFGTYKNLPCITTEGMVETEKENAYAIVDIYDDKIVLTGKGRSKSYTLAFE